MLKRYFEPGALFSYPAYRNLWISTILTILAMSAFPIALAVTILDAGGTITTLGLILGARVLSGVLFSPVGGVVVDRLPRKTVLIAAIFTYRRTKSGLISRAIFCHQNYP